MPPLLALIICTTFVLLLLRLDRKQSPKVSLALWIPTIYMLLASSKPLAVWFGVGGVDLEEGSPIDRVVLSTLFLLGLLILIKRQFKWFSAIKQNPWVMLLLGYMLISILWSEMPFVSFKRWARQLIAVVMAFLVATEPEPRQALQSIFRRTIYMLIPFSYVLIHYFPQYGREYGRWSGALMWIGVASQKNGLAMLCLLSAFFLIWTFIRRWQGRDKPVAIYQTPVTAFLLFLTIWLFMGPSQTLTYSATSFVALAIGLTGYFVFLWLKKINIFVGQNILTAIVLLFIIYGTITPFIGKLSIIDVSSALDRRQTLTERTDIWTYLIPHAMEKAMLGHGFGGFWTDAIREATSSHAHNGYLDIILNIGFVGLFLFSMFLLSCCRRAQKLLLDDFERGVLWICFLLMAVVHNITESSMVGFTGSMSAVILFMAITSTAATSYTRKSHPTCEVMQYKMS